MVLSSPRTIWLLIVTPAFITAAAHETNYVLVRQACSAQRNVALYAVMIVALVLIALMGLVSYMTWRHVGAEWPAETADAATTTRFIAVLGILGSGFFFLVTFAQAIATVYYDPCQL
jgi:membrane-associated HD superfamily phosphohydrolase